jgi:2-polyprenyl-6-methoxyphenol hydroxylase-like FAD-dependent oxidoreductase
VAAESRTALVVGAGMSGLACAIGLRLAGWGVRVIDRAPGSATAGAGIVLQPNGLRALDRLGALDGVLEAGCALRTLVAAEDGEAVKIELDEVWGGARPQTTATLRRSLIEALERRLSELGVTPVEDELLDIISTNPIMTVRLAAGGVESADLIVACDGVHSRIRQGLLGIAAEPLGKWWARWTAAERLLLPGSWSTETSGEATCGAYDLGASGTHVFLQLPVDAIDGDAEEVAAELAPRLPLLRDAIDSGAALIHAGPGYGVRPHRWELGSLAFAGDAAHAMSPTISQGGGLALEDGIALGLEATAADPIDRILERYRWRRAERVGWAARIGELQLRRSTRRRRAGRLEGRSAAAFMRSSYAPLMEAL